MTLIGNGTVITLDRERPVIEDGAVLIEDGVIKRVGETKILRRDFPRAIFIDARGGMIMPGFINAHTHFYSTLARGMTSRGPAPRNFREILKKVWWKLDKALTHDDIYYSALLGAIEGIKRGLTTVIDHHSSPRAVDGSLDCVARACRETHIRAVLAYEVSDRDGEEVARKGMEENMRFYHLCQESGFSNLASLFGLHASFTLSQKTLIKCAETAQGTDIGFHIHTAEGVLDRDDARQKYSMSPVERLETSGLWGPQSIAAHCVHVHEEDMDILKERAVNVVHNPQSNMGNAVGYAPVLTMQDRGLLVGMGTDGFTMDMLESLKTASLLHKHEQKDPSAGTAQVLDMLFRGNRVIGEKILGQKVGQLSEGWAADLIILDYKPFTPLHEHNYTDHILMGMAGNQVQTVIIAGQMVMEDRQIRGIDEEEIRARGQEKARQIWQRMEEVG